MKRALLIATLSTLAACSDAPLQPSLDVQPQFATEVGSGATWYFKGVIRRILGGPYQFGDPVEGSFEFRVVGDDSIPGDPCRAEHELKATFEYTLAGRTYRASGDGSVTILAECSSAPQIYFQTKSINDSWMDLRVRNPAGTEDVPLTPPPVTAGFDTFRYMYLVGGFGAYLTELFTCKDGGWKLYGFKNQGQCIRYGETGKDSR